MLIRKERLVFLILTLLASCGLAENPTTNPVPPRATTKLSTGESEFGSCRSDATSIKTGSLDMGALCIHPDGSPCAQDNAEVIWMENASIRIAVAPKMGGAVVFLGKKGVNAQSGVTCAEGDSICQEQWIGNRVFDRGRQFQVALFDQSALDQNPVRKVLCNSLDFLNKTFLVGGCGWNPTQAGGWQGIGGFMKSPINTLPGETGGCAVAPGPLQLNGNTGLPINYCSNYSDVDAKILNLEKIPVSQNKKLYIRSGHYPNFLYNNPPEVGDTALARTDIWSEQWYCLKEDSFEMQVALHHDGDDWHWNYNHSPMGPGAALASVWLQGGFNQFLFGDQGKTVTVFENPRPANALIPDSIDRFHQSSSDKWMSFVRNNVPVALTVNLDIPSQNLSEDFGGTSADYWGNGPGGDPDQEYPVSSGNLYEALNVRPHSTYFWNITGAFQE